MTPKWHSIFVDQNEETDRPLNQEPIRQFSKPYDVDDASKNLLTKKYRITFKCSQVKNACLRQREFGDLKACKKLRENLSRSFVPWRSWTGASKDVLSVAWGPRGHFAVGAGTDHVHDRDRPYNRSNNLLIGQINGYGSSLEQLMSHFVLRDQETVVSNPRENSPDPELYATVSHVTFSSHYPSLYSAGYDQKVRVWDLPDSVENQIRCSHVLQHSDNVDIISKPIFELDHTRIFATAQQSRICPISIYSLTNESGITAPKSRIRPVSTFSCPRALRANVIPSSLEWGPHERTKSLLLAGFTEHSSEKRTDTDGQVCLWDINRPDWQQQLYQADESVFDIAWSPARYIIAAATTPRAGSNLTHRKLTRTVIRTWSPHESPSRVYEMECPALDINDIRFHPINDNLITASCTDGRVYVYDARMGHNILLVLEHDEPIEQTDGQRSSEEQDVGVRFTSWDRDGRFLYTGASDGRVGCWDIRLSPDEALVQEIAALDSGVMAGSFSPDSTKLLLGTVKGSVEILSLGAASRQSDDLSLSVSTTELTGSFDKMPTEPSRLATDAPNEGINTAKGLLRDGRLVRTKYGIGQGPYYDGPWDLAAREPNADPQNSELQPDFAAQQFDRTTRRRGVAKGGKTQSNSYKARAAAKAIEKERRFLCISLQSLRSMDLKLDSSALSDRGSNRTNSNQHPSPHQSLSPLPVYQSQSKDQIQMMANKPKRVGEWDPDLTPRSRKKSREIMPSGPISTNSIIIIPDDEVKPGQVSSSTSFPDQPASRQSILPQISGFPAAIHRETAINPFSTQSSAPVTPVTSRFTDWKPEQAIVERPSTPTTNTTSFDFTGSGSSFTLTPSSRGKNGYVIPPRMVEASQDLQRKPKTTPQGPRFYEL